MDHQFSLIIDNESLEELIGRSNTEPVVLFKHSATCALSTTAYEEMTRVKGNVGLVVVQQANEVSREIEARTGVQHESPQVIILRAGKPVWDASHWGVTAEAVTEALRRNS